ncbi:unnamed protein product, partial [Durusdinium trenchii]
MQPKFVPEPDVSDIREPVRPPLKLCTMSADGILAIPNAEREKWLADPVRNPDWRTRLANFDAVFSPAASGQQQQQQAAAANTSTAEVDLATPVVQPVQSQCATPPHMTSDEFKKRYPEITCSVTINMGAQSITCHYADNKIFLVCTANFQIPGILSPDARPIFLYAGGTWISDSSKAGGVHAKDFLSKETNANKAVEFHLESSQDMDAKLSLLCHKFLVVLEETGSSGVSDSSPMTLYALLTMLEKRGVLDAKLTGHKVERPPEVVRGEASDSITIAHEAFSVFRPNPVAQVKQVKASNIAGFIGLRALTSSNFITL